MRLIGEYKMKKIKLNKDLGKMVKAHGYEFDATIKYIINLKNEIEEQAAILTAINAMGLPALDDYHKWLTDNGFNPIMPNPTNDFVSKYFGKKPLWKTNLSQGVVVKAEDDDDYYIVMECSRLNTGFKYTQIIVTMGGCV